jgi:hypothetical protein
VDERLKVMVPRVSGEAYSTFCLAGADKRRDASESKCAKGYRAKQEEGQGAGFRSRNRRRSVVVSVVLNDQFEMVFLELEDVDVLVVLELESAQRDDIELTEAVKALVKVDHGIVLDRVTPSRGGQEKNSDGYNESVFELQGSLL